MNLTEARNLAADGEFRQAIEALSAANRATRDSEIEEALVRIRCEAFAPLKAVAQPRRPWPPAITDPFPDIEAAVPETTPALLTAEVLGGSILHHGCLMVRELFSPETVAQLTDDLDRAFAARDAFVEGAPAAETKPWYARFDPPPDVAPLLDNAREFQEQAGALWAAESPRGFFDLIDAYNATGIVDAIAGYFAEPAALSINKSVLRSTARRQSTANPPWHQDGAFIRRGLRAVDVWVPLNRCGGGTASPGLEIVPRRIDHIIARDPASGASKNALTPQQVAAAADGIESIFPEFAPGDALVFDEVFVHRTGMTAKTPGERRAIEAWFFPPSVFPAAYVPIVV
jgi:hypothetical protein